MTPEAAPEASPPNESGEPKLRTTSSRAKAGAQEPRELFVRYALKGNRSIVTLRAVDHGHACIVEAEVRPDGAHATGPGQPGPYTFPDAQAASAFVAEALDALTYLGCETRGQ